MKRKLIVMCVALLIFISALSMPNFEIKEYSNINTIYADDTSDKLTYKIQGYDNNSGDYIISAINVKDFGAVGDGKKDDTLAFMKALELAGDNGGGIVFVPSGIYKISAPLTVNQRVTLRGQWNNPLSKNSSPETILVVNYDGGTASGQPFITMGGKATVRDLKIYYQKQNIESVKPFPFTIGAASFLCNTMNITLVNSYNGINCGYEFGGSAQHVENIFGTILNEGIVFDNNYETSAMTNIYFSSKYWNEYDGTPCEAIRKITRLDGMPIRLGKADDSMLYNINIDLDDYIKGIHFFKNPLAVGQSVAYGLAHNIHGAKIIKDIPGDMPRIVETDKIGKIGSVEHCFAKDRFSSKAALYNVKDYGAVSNGIEDDSNAVILAIREANKNGGGVVFFPAGKYKISKKIIVYSNIELKGEWDGPNMYSPSELHMYYGENKPDDAMIELENGSGINGFLIKLPLLTPQTIRPYSWVVTGKGNNTYVEYVTPLNVYNGFNFYDNKCDNFSIKGIYGTALNIGLKIGGGSVNGITQTTFFSYGPWWEELQRQDDNILKTYSNNNSFGYIIGDVKNMCSLSMTAYGLSSGVIFDDQNGKGAENIQIIRMLLDVPEADYNLEFKAGNNISILGLSAPSIRGVGVKAHDSFEGKARIYGLNQWGGTWIQKVELGEEDIVIYKEGDKKVDTIKHKFPFAPKNKISLVSITLICCSIIVLLSISIFIGIFVKMKKSRKNKENKL